MTNAEKIIDGIFSNFSREELLDMTHEQLMETVKEYQDEMHMSRCEDKQDEMIYGNPADDEYNMSDSHRADVQSEQWAWLKNE